jgi:hypothetical protein
MFETYHLCCCKPTFLDVFGMPRRSSTACRRPVFTGARDLGEVITKCGDGVFVTKQALAAGLADHSYAANPNR